MSGAVPAIWRARDDSGERGDTRRMAHIVAADGRQPAAGEAALLGFACDAGVLRNQGRPGAAQGPAAIRRMLAGIPVHGLDILHDAGDVACDGSDLEDAQQRYAKEVARLLSAGARTLALGGGHEIAWGSFMGLRQWLDASGDEAAVLVLNLDAHFDLRTGRPASSGTPFDQVVTLCAQRGLPVQYACLGVSRLSNTVALFDRAREVGAFWVEDVDMRETDLAARLADVDRLLEQVSHVYLTVDLDVLPAAVMPGVSAPAAYGVPLEVVERIVTHVAASGKLRLADLAEANPDFDIDNHGARVAARLAWRILTAWR
ncbi:formimidoylglutamase [Bordetella holmesii]|uniref:Formimidoylglutamase n=2 Tax=Bordetella holmesii TaxID=35814 RepID=A0A158M4I4_9BORD|nr:formimidoylglutamase [Bordetella holmesii]AHV94492.1 formimidoylglutamase [Bordetella holmesii ATCC 51541]EWM40842.1 formimidoylglutamase [Bordetella holmesii 35009]EWM44738.1 formimidoylglutamase [Bordetella holmesii 70147]AMD46778.1 formimidoylglutamase [Bordetella holmesii H558]AMD47831.1 formimidoylglutamase [Bordetella holmesii F627]